ncbi:MAG: energy transducer TonB [Candidatus Mcinerneyibacterium aminivorans]|uniref:Energy transducer TonB n=1 Tax=Candidatus Mcinerneyibacterium aminivorans TaxID=2703815 RepID=A0A5D0MER8_9BACT|nr:MAG: energy transducer TonB [Candidatus Mcinerneyibacterium aminivorans]
MASKQQVTRLQDIDPLYYRWGAIITFVLILIIFWSLPEPRPRPYAPKKVERVQMEEVEQTQMIEEPTQPQKVQKPKQVVEAAEGEMVEEDETIADTSLDLDEEAVDSDIPGPDEFIPYSKPPKVVSKPSPRYPELAREAGLEGRVVLKVFVDKQGNVKDAILLKGVSEALNEAAMSAAYKAKFKPAENNGQPVGVWIAFYYTFKLH